MEDAALYQALHRLEAKGFIEAEWGTSENNRRARYYALTVIGRRPLRAEVTSWRRYADAILRVIDETGCANSVSAWPVARLVWLPASAGRRSPAFDAAEAESFGHNHTKKWRRLASQWRVRLNPIGG